MGKQLSGKSFSYAPFCAIFNGYRQTKRFLGTFKENEVVLIVVNRKIYITFWSHLFYTNILKLHFYTLFQNKK
ncbi:hypothetical protein DHC50_06630 [Arenibacter sp. A80]|jgi:hypothetical protein|nr:hypothetical protein [Arenibacter sp. A80]RFT57286.1 hypothetical protein D0S24_06625 [Arenibacter sp. P308M17]